MESLDDNEGSRQAKLRPRKRHKCDRCGNCFTRKGGLREHERIDYYTCQHFLIPMREIFFRVPRLPEKGLGPSSKETGASTNEAVKM